MQNYVGQQIDRYRVIERLGTGGMAVVYKAYDTRLERDVAIKLIRVEEIPPSQHERLMKRFEREAKAMAKFSHPNIVPVYDYGEVDGSPYLVMEYIPGGTLKSRIDRPVDYVQALRWLVPIADALRYAHERGVIHRDVKPSNILFDEEDRPVLTDFGIAKILETDEATLTGTGMGVGTPEYMAPEQWQGKASEATDQYALGVVLYELITGKKPYSADTPAAIAILQATEPLPRPSAMVPKIPDVVEKVLYKALARDPRDRYQSMAIFHKALVELEQGSVFEIGEEPEKSEKGISEIRREEIVPDEYSDNSLSASENEKIGGSKKQESTSDDELVGGGRTVDEVELSHQTSDRLSKSANKGQAKNQQIGDKKSQTALNKKKVGLDISSAVIIVFIISVICLAVLVKIIGNYSNKSTSSSSSSNSINRTATMEMRQTEDAKSALTATARVAKAATAQAKPTATAKAAHDLLNNFIKDADIIFEEESYSLDHYDDDFVEVYSTGIDEKNFILEVTFVNPYDLSVGAWDYGIMFRHTGSNDQFRLYLSSSETWYLENWVESKVQSFSGDLYINTSGGQKNKIQFVAISDMGYLFVNNNFIAELDLSARDFSGGIKIGTGFINNHEVEGYATEFKNLVIYKIGGEESTSTPTSHSTLSESNHSAISVNSRAFSTEWNYYYSGRFDLQVIFENEDGWGKGNYLLKIETVDGPHECNFYGPTEDECKIVNYNNEEYLVCTRGIFVDYETYTPISPPYYCSYEIQLLKNGESIYSFDFSYTFDRE